MLLFFLQSKNQNDDNGKFQLSLESESRMNSAIVTILVNPATYTKKGLAHNNNFKHIRKKNNEHYGILVDRSWRAASQHAARASFKALWRIKIINIIFVLFIYESKAKQFFSLNH